LCVAPDPRGCTCVGNGRSSRVCGGMGKSTQSWMTPAPGGVRAAPDSAWCDVEGDEAAALIFLSSCLPAPGRQRGFSGMSRFVALHVRERMPVSRASPASQGSGPCGALRSSARRGDRGGRRGRLRNGIRQKCAGRRLPATTWSLRRSRAGCGCSHRRAGARHRPGRRRGCWPPAEGGGRGERGRAVGFRR